MIDDPAQGVLVTETAGGLIAPRGVTILSPLPPILDLSGCGRQIYTDLLHGYPPVTGRESDARSFREEPYGYSIRIYSDHGQGQRCTLLRGAAIQIVHTDILQPRAGKALHTPPGGIYMDII